MSILLDSIDESLDDLNTPVHDWDYVEDRIAGEARRGALVGWLHQTLDACIPCSRHDDNLDLTYLQKYKIYTTLFYVTDAYVGAHVMAQNKLSEYYGRGPPGPTLLDGQFRPSSPEQIAVCTESARNVVEAQRQVSACQPKISV